MDKKLIDVMFSRETFYNMMKQFAESMVPALREQMKEHLDPEDHEEFERFQEAFVKETLWLWDGNFDEFSDMIQAAIDETYTPEEQEVLYKIYTEYPWMVEKSQKLGPLVFERMMPFGQKVAEQAAKNVMESSDFDHLTDSTDAWEDNDA